MDSTTAGAETPLVHPDQDVRRRLAIVLDIDDLVVARRLAQTLRPWFGVVKVGLELFSAAGPDAIETMAELGYEVFVDLKLHDIPTTVGKTSRVLGSLGASYVTMHAFGGVDMLRAGVSGLAEGARSGGLPEPTALAVTVLTSDDGAPPHILAKRVAVAIEAGCGGLVCAVGDVREARLLGPGLTIVTPGIRPAGTPTHDQARSATPQEAFDAGADLLVIGRAVTAADDPVVAAAELVESLTL
ncbi:MAG: putative orotidine 5-phosphate decarboxylase [Actinomycetia bacterium]|nr:putative orotidine 5-phosphate decarboxylase [Actinomycetes bacterium]